MAAQVQVFELLAVRPLADLDFAHFQVAVAAFCQLVGEARRRVQVAVLAERAPETGGSFLNTIHGFFLSRCFRTRGSHLRAAARVPPAASGSAIRNAPRPQSPGWA